MERTETSIEQYTLSTTTTGHDFSLAEKDEYGVFYSNDGIRLLSIDTKSFSCCKYKVKEGTKIICDFAFAGCSASNIIIPDSVSIIGERAFQNSNSLREVVLGNSIKTIKRFAFKSCKYLQELRLPESLEIIEEMAFSYTGIKEMILPQSIRKITGNPITYNNVKFISQSPNFIIEDENLFTQDRHVLISFQSHESSFIIPKTATAISSYAFWFCLNLQHITIPSTIKYIGKNPFAHTKTKIENLSNEFVIKNDLLLTKDEKILIGCYSNKEIINISHSVNIIKGSAFAENEVLEIILPDSVVKIEDNAFENCKHLQKIELPNSIKHLGNALFYGCSLLKDVKLPQYLNYCGDFIFSGCSSLQTMEIPSSMKSITQSMFSGCLLLENISIPSSVTRINRAAFYQCKSLREVIIPKSVQYIDRQAFRYCRNLKAVYIPNSVKRIGMYAFSDCQEITVRRRGRSTYREYDSMNLIATTHGNKENIKRMLPKYLHSIVRELTYKEFVNRNVNLYKNAQTEEVYDYGSLECVKCPRCGDWYYAEDGVCDTCGYPWNE